MIIDRSFSGLCLSGNAHHMEKMMETKNLVDEMPLLHVSNTAHVGSVAAQV